MGFDPVGVDEDNPHSFNRYAYGNNNPYKYLDPDGRVAMFIYAAAVAAPAVFNIGSREVPYAQRAVTVAMNRITALSNSPIVVNAVEAAAGLVPGAPPGTISPTSPIGMSRAIQMAVDHVGTDAKVLISGSGAFQFVSSFVNSDGKTVTKIARFDVNMKSTHVQQYGPHLNLETQINGKTVRSGPMADPHLKIDPSTIRPGDVPQ
jgi:hypothetical protein